MRGLLLSFSFVERWSCFAAAATMSERRLELETGEVVVVVVLALLACREESMCGVAGSEAIS